MATYAELLQAEQDPALNNRVRVAIIVAAELIRLEVLGQTPTVAETTRFNNRKAWAKEAFQDPFGKSKQMLWAVLAQNRSATLAQILADNGATSDATVQAAVNVAVDAFRHRELKMPYERYRRGSNATIMSTDLNSMANNALVVAAADYDNSAGATGDGFTMAEYEFAGSFPSAPTAGSVLSGWWLATPDGTNREDGSTSITPARGPDFVFPVRAVTTAQRIVVDALLPPGALRMLLKNDGTGQALASSGNTVKIRPYTYDGV